MNFERLALSPQELELRQEAIDFAEIRNPLGASPLLAERAKTKLGITENVLAHELGILWRMSDTMIAIGSGSTDLIEKIPALFLPPGSRAVLPVPTYFGLLDKVREESVIQVPLLQKDGFAHTSEYLRTLLDVIRTVKPGLVWLCSPNNPTGVVIPQWHIEEIAQATPGLVIVDEAYQEQVDPTNQKSAMHLIGDHSNIVVTRTFSKAYGLPEIRVGIAIATAKIIEKIRENRAKLVGPDSLAKASAALMDQQHIWKSHFLMTEETERVWEKIHRMKHIEMGARSASGVCIVRHRNRNLWTELTAAGIKTTDFNGHRGLQGQRFVRLGLLDHERNTKLIEALKGSDTP